MSWGLGPERGSLLPACLHGMRSAVHDRRRPRVCCGKLNCEALKGSTRDLIVLLESL